MFSKWFGKKWYQRIGEKYVYSIDKTSISVAENTFKAKFVDSKLIIEVYSFIDGCFRVHFQLEGEEEQYNRFDVSKSEIITNQQVLNTKLHIENNNLDDKCELTSNNYKAIVYYSPFKLEFYDSNRLVSTINDEQQLLFITGEETTVASDISFHGSNIRISGLAERVTPNNIADGTYQMTNVDAYGFNDKKIASIYGNIPFIIAHSPELSCGFFWANSSETYVNITTKDQSRSARFLSEGGFADCFIFICKPLKIIQNYCELTGHPMMPPLWSLGYHQCRWGYKTQAICEEVISNLENENFPFDCFWLDLDHLKDRSPWHYNPKTFPNPDHLESILLSKSRQFVRLCDCHLPTSGDSPELKKCQEKNLLIKKRDNSIYHGFCWPGVSCWVDFFNPEAREFWSERCKQQENGYFWNDMNEPSSFGLLNKSLPKDCKTGQWTDKETHNAYATYQSFSTFNGLKMRDEKRPFSLSRAFFSGTQKYAFVWTGDNGSSKTHMMKSLSMIANANICGVTFIGADVGGFSHSIDDEHLVEWFNVACWTYPFFREHCIFTAKNREPYLSKYKNLLKEIVEKRYKFLHFWYTAAWRAHQYSCPIVRPLFIDFPDVEFEHDRSYEVLVDSFIFFSITDDESNNQRTVKLPPGLWYDINNKCSSGEVVVENDFRSNPVFFRGGRIVLIINSVVECTKKTIQQPTTLFVYLDDNDSARGDVYIDDYETSQFENGVWIHREFKFENSKLICKECEDSPKNAPVPVVNITKIVVVKRDTTVEKEVSLTANENWEISI